MNNTEYPNQEVEEFAGVEIGKESDAAIQALDNIIQYCEREKERIRNEQPFDADWGVCLLCTNKSENPDGCRNIGAGEMNRVMNMLQTALLYRMAKAQGVSMEQLMASLS